MPRKYEVVYIFDAGLEDAAINDTLTRVHALLGTNDVAVEHWGKRQLAYPIGRRETGHYSIAHFEAEATTLPEFERALKLDEGVVRYLITLHEHEVGAPPMTEEEIAAGRGRASDDDDDED
jgi:small subunit ribosomal protein S6